MQDERTGFIGPAASTGQGCPQQAAGSIISSSRLLAHQGTCSLGCIRLGPAGTSSGSGDVCPGSFYLQAPVLSPLRALPPNPTLCYSPLLWPLSKAEAGNTRVRVAPGESPLFLATALVACVCRWVLLGGRCPPNRAGRGRAGRGAPFC